MSNPNDSNKSTQVIDSRVYLRSLDLALLVGRYFNNEFVNLISPLPVDLSVIDEKPKTVVTVKDNANTMSYQLDLGDGRSFACIGYKVCDKSGAYAQLDPNKKYSCMYCLRKIKQNPLGIPIRREERPPNNPELSVKSYYHMIDIFCTFNCVLAELRKRLNNAIYSQSMTYLGEIYFKCTGKDISELNPASDQRLLKIFNGPMSWEEFHANTVTYSEKPGNMYFLPVIEYLEQNP